MVLTTNMKLTKKKNKTKKRNFGFGRFACDNSNMHVWNTKV